MIEAEKPSSGPGDGPPVEEEWSLDTKDLVIPRQNIEREKIAGMTEQQFAKAAVICVLLFLVMGATGLLLERLYPAKPRQEFLDCRPMSDSTARLACYDRAAAESKPEPAKGGAPSLDAKKLPAESEHSGK